jgi:hypothetical protein
MVYKSLDTMMRLCRPLVSRKEGNVLEAPRAPDATKKDVFRPNLLFLLATRR